MAKAKSIFTVKERLAIWRKVRRKVKNLISKDETKGLCHLIDKSIEEFLGRKPEGKRPYSDTIQDRYPEFYAHKPNHAGAYWWDLTSSGMKVRLEVCNEIIKKLEYKK